MKKNFIAIAAYSLLFLSGCSSVGVQYKQPTEQEDSAKLLPSNGVFIHTFNEKGCYIGRTHIDQPMRIHADQEAVFAFDEVYGDFYCRVPFSFVPEKNATYKISPVVSGNIPRKVDLSNVKEIRCSAHVFKIDGEESIPVKVTPRKLKMGFACIKLVPQN